MGGETLAILIIGIPLALCFLGSFREIQSGFYDEDETEETED